ncbi:hypothetical protein D932_01311 [Enterococcus casseliflavus 14-MB-W-14]|nr:hypothetical protein D932_01311 [Enterococcus casseliflavus 14-MB-W-14]
MFPPNSWKDCNKILFTYIFSCIKKPVFLRYPQKNRKKRRPGKDVFSSIID